MVGGDLLKKYWQYFKFGLQKLWITPPGKIPGKIRLKLKQKFSGKLKIRKYTGKELRDKFEVKVKLLEHLKITELNISDIDEKTALYLSEMYLKHRFDLLGSGWISTAYNKTVLGVENHIYHSEKIIETSAAPEEWLNNLISLPHLEYTTRLWKLIDSQYQPIDWQKDFKSGYRWNAQKCCKNMSYGHLPGVDIKVPWELARLQHLPQMAIFAIKLPEYKQKLGTDFRNQLLDFFAMNPPGMGVNWVCCMDVAIRSANILIANDLFCQISPELKNDTEFQAIIAANMAAHGTFITENLEWTEELTSNHYLSNIAGLVFIGAYLHNHPEAELWLSFAIQELIRETEKQFYPDGANFEASTSYHRLSGEMVIFATAVIAGLPPAKISKMENTDPAKWQYLPKLQALSEQEYLIRNQKIIFPPRHKKILQKLSKFTSDITKPCGEIVQFGDNDSGRFFRLSPCGIFMTAKEAEKKYLNLQGYCKIISDENELFFDENQLIHKSLLSAAAGLENEKPPQKEFAAEFSIVKSLTHDNCIFIPDYEYYLLGYQLDYHRSFTIKPDANSGSLLDEIELIKYENTGIYILKSQLLYLCISAGPNGQNDNGGHTHNDKLSFELSLDNQSVIKDPGTYLYTPLPEKRNQFRRTAAHQTIQIENWEQNRFLPGRYGLFSMENDSSCIPVEMTPGLISFFFKGNGVCHLRRFTITDSELIIDDYVNKPFSYPEKFPFYSNGYGKITAYEN